MDIFKNIQIGMEDVVGKFEGFINVIQLHKALGRHLTAAFHAFSGCDFNTALFTKGKKRLPFSIMSSSE